jgi:hypothetical protein
VGPRYVQFAARHKSKTREESKDPPHSCISCLSPLNAAAIRIANVAVMPAIARIIVGVMKLNPPLSWHGGTRDALGSHFSLRAVPIESLTF